MTVSSESGRWGKGARWLPIVEFLVLVPLCVLAGMALEFLILMPWRLPWVPMAFLCAGLGLFLLRRLRRRWKSIVFLGYIAGLTWFVGSAWLTRTELQRLAERVTPGMERADVQTMFTDFEQNPPRFKPFASSSETELRTVYSHPRRSALQSYEHIVIDFDEQGKVVRSKVTLDP